MTKILSYPIVKGELAKYQMYNTALVLPSPTMWSPLAYYITLVNQMKSIKLRVTVQFILA